MPPAHICHLCGLREAGSREHLPGFAATNNTPVEVTYLSGSSESGSARHETRLERDGFIVRTICDHCNRRTGGNYGTAYKDFVEKFARSGVLDAGQRRTWVTLPEIQPLRVVKQMASMFLASQPDLSHPHWTALREFVLKRDAKLPSESLRLYLYRNTSAYGRVVPLTGIMSAWGCFPQTLLAEIAWPPLGIVFGFEPHPLFASMREITDWGIRYGFRDRASPSFSVPQYDVATHWPLGFGGEKSAHEWANREGIVMLLHTGERESGSVHMPALTKRVPPSRST